jgi:hypothetical protein
MTVRGYIPCKDFWRFKSLTLLKYRRVLTTDCELKSFFAIVSNYSQGRLVLQIAKFPGV